jgi:U3 small nucleolar RNA-associated protein 14
MSADITLRKIGRVEHNYWFDAECEHVTVIKNEACRRIQQRNHTHKALEEYHVTRREEKRVRKKRRRNITSVKLKNWNISGT